MEIIALPLMAALGCIDGSKSAFDSRDSVGDSLYLTSTTDSADTGSLYDSQSTAFSNWQVERSYTFVLDACLNLSTSLSAEEFCEGYPPFVSGMQDSTFTKERCLVVYPAFTSSVARIVERYTEDNTTLEGAIRETETWYPFANLDVNPSKTHAVSIPTTIYSLTILGPYNSENKSSIQCAVEVHDFSAYAVPGEYYESLSSPVYVTSRLCAMLESEGTLTSDNPYCLGTNVDTNDVSTSVSPNTSFSLQYVPNIDDLSIFPEYATPTISNYSDITMVAESQTSRCMSFIANRNPQLDVETQFCPTAYSSLIASNQKLTNDNFVRMIQDSSAVPKQ